MACWLRPWEAGYARSAENGESFRNAVKNQEDGAVRAPLFSPGAKAFLISFWTSLQVPANQDLVDMFSASFSHPLPPIPTSAIPAIPQILDA